MCVWGRGGRAAVGKAYGLKGETWKQCLDHMLHQNNRRSRIYTVSPGSRRGMKGAFGGGAKGAGAGAAGV